MKMKGLAKKEPRSDKDRDSFVLNPTFNTKTAYFTALRVPSCS